MRIIRMRRAVAMLAAALCLGMGMSVGAAAAHAKPRIPTGALVVPGQLIAKGHTEILGRLPTQREWAAAADDFTAAGCNTASAAAFLRAIYRSAEFASRSYDNGAKVLTLFRGALNRDPHRSEHASVVHQLGAGLSWSAAVESQLTGIEFTDTVVPKMCSTTSTSYGFGSNAPESIGAGSEGFSGTGAELQLLLNDAAPGDTVWLAQKALIPVAVPLILPKGVRLATVNLPRPSHYALQARLVRTAAFAGEVVRLNPESVVESVWIDGQRSVIPRPALQGGTGVNAFVLGGNIVNSTMSGSSGWTAIQLGTHDRTACYAEIRGSLVTAYASPHQTDFSDGISSYCEEGVIERNQVVDATDVALIIFPPSSGAAQRTQVRYNTVLSAGNSGYGALAADPLMSGNPSFLGAVVHDNLFWTSDRTHFDIGLAVGTKAWFGARSVFGTGVQFLDNTTGTLVARVSAGAAVSGMLDVVVQGNTLNVAYITDGSACPNAVIGASLSQGWASGSIQEPLTDAPYDACINGQ